MECVAITSNTFYRVMNWPKKISPQIDSAKATSAGEVKKKTTIPQLPKIFLNLKPGFTRIWIVLSVLYLIFATVHLIDNWGCTDYPDPNKYYVYCDSIYIWYGYANIGTMAGIMLLGLALLWLLPYILVFWLGRGLYWLLCWIKDGFTKVE